MLNAFALKAGSSGCERAAGMAGVKDMDAWANRILFIDGEAIVIDKPPGLAVHPGPRTRDSLEDHLADLRFGFHRSPSPVHRLLEEAEPRLLPGAWPLNEGDPCSGALGRLAGVLAGQAVVGRSILIATGLILFLVTFLVNFAARWIIGRNERRMAK